MRKKVNLPSKALKEVKNLLAITMGKLVTHQTNVGAMESATTTISIVTRLMNARRNQNLKVNVTNARHKVTRNLNADLKHSI